RAAALVCVQLSFSQLLSFLPAPRRFTVSSLFSFHCSADHRALHSFPTRRSSDLSFHLQPIRWLRLRGHRLCQHSRNRRPNKTKRDRKSTRLNSSHEWISYAVFCLKKKRK